MDGRMGAAVLAMGLVAGAPAGAQTMLDTLHQLKATLGQLGGRRAAQAPASPGGAQAAPRAATDDAMVPASALPADGSDTALAAAPLVPRRVATFDVRGLKLGMSPREVARIAAQEGFRRRWTDLLTTSGTFEAEATALADRQLNRPAPRPRGVELATASGVDAAGDVLSVAFTLEPAGPRLSNLVYKARLDGSSREQTTAALIRRYGPPSRRGDVEGSLSWADSSAVMRDLSSPGLIAIVGEDQLVLTLDQSVDHEHTARDRLQARAREIAAARGAGVKF